MTKKILFIGMTPNPGGLETYMINIFSQLQGKTFHFYFVNTYFKPIAYSKYIKRKGGVIYNIPIKRNITKYFKRYHIAKIFFKLHRNFDIVHINSLSINQLYWAKAAKKYHIKHIIFQSHNSGIIYTSRIIAFFGKLLSFYNKVYLKYTHNIHMLAASTKCGQFMFGNINRFKVIPNGINTHYFYPNLEDRYLFRKKLHLNDRYKILITTARLDKQKNYAKIIKVFKVMYNIDNLVRLVIIGSGVELSYIQRMVKFLGIDKDVYFLGRCSKEKIARLLNIADLMIMPSFFEAVPFSLTEAQSCGIPSIVSIEGLPIEANITGRVFYVSLKRNNVIWAKDALKILKYYPYNFHLRLEMNKEVYNSPYNLYNSIYKIKTYYDNFFK